MNTYHLIIVQVVWSMNTNIVFIYLGQFKIAFLWQFHCYYNVMAAALVCAYVYEV